MPEFGTPELQSLRAYLNDQRVACRVTSTNEGYPGDGVHSRTSNHYKGLAIDIAGMTPSWSPSILLPIFQAFVPIEKQLTELIYARAPYNIKYGRRVPLYAQAQHHNHVHVAVPKGWRWQSAAPVTTVKVRPMLMPALVLEPIVAELKSPEGGVWLLSQNGAVYSFGGARYHGGMNGSEHFKGRMAARLEPNGQGYTIIATSGETYHFP